MVKDHPSNVPAHTMRQAVAHLLLKIRLAPYRALVFAAVGVTALLLVLRLRLGSPPVIVSGFTRRLWPAVNGATKGSSTSVPISALSWHHDMYSGRDDGHAALAAVAQGHAKLALGVLVLSCGRASCAAGRQAARTDVYNASSWPLLQPEGMSVCPGHADAVPPRRVPWADLWARAYPPSARFLVGAEGMSAEELSVVQQEQALYGDILLLPSADTYHDLHEKVIHGLVALHEVVQAPGDHGFTAVLKTDADSYIRLPELMWRLLELLPSARDDSSGRAQYTDVVWGRFLEMTQPHPMEHPFAGGMGYIFTAGLARSLVQQYRSKSAIHHARSGGGLAGVGGSAEDLGMAHSFSTRPRVDMNDPLAFHDVITQPPTMNAAPVTPSSLVIHHLKESAHWVRVRDLFQGSAALRGAAQGAHSGTWKCDQVILRGV